MGKINIRVNLIISLTDSFTGSNVLKGNAFVRTHNGIYALKKENGCFVFAHCHHGLYRITVESQHYVSQAFDVYFDNQIKEIHLSLMPSKTYPFDGYVTKVFGTAENSDNSYAVFFPEGSHMRLIGSCKKGSDKIKIFCQKEALQNGQKICIFGSEFQLFTAHKLPDDTMTYMLDSPANFEITDSCQVGLAYKVQPPDGKNDYFIAVRGSYDKAMMICGDSFKEIALQQTENRFDF